MSPVSRLALAAALAAALGLTACGSDDAGSATDAVADATTSPSSAPDADASGEDEGDTGSIGVTIVNVDGVKYEFADSGRGQCKDYMGALLVALSLTEVDDEPAEGGALSVSLYPEGMESDSSFKLTLPDGNLLAGYNEIGLDAPPVGLVRNGLVASGLQEVVAMDGRSTLANVQIAC